MSRNHNERVLLTGGSTDVEEGVHTPGLKNGAGISSQRLHMLTACKFLSFMVPNSSSRSVVGTKDRRLKFLGFPLCSFLLLPVILLRSCLKKVLEQRT